MNNPKVTVLMPAYNSEKYIAEAIASVLNQSFVAFELLIINDGSTDATADIIQSFSDERIRIIYQNNGGVASALNTGLTHARGEYIARFDADDICMDSRLQIQADFLDTNPEYVMVGSDAEYILENGDHLFNFRCIAHSHEGILEKLYLYCPFIHSSVMYRREDVLAAGGYSIHAHSFEDYLLWTQLSKKGQLANLKIPLIKVRYNPSSITIDEKWRGRRFKHIKRTAIRNGFIKKNSGDEILTILNKQDTKRYKTASYYALCAKKFLTDNFRPDQSRRQLEKAIVIYPFKAENYMLYVVSFFPEKLIKWLHQKSPNRL